VGVYPGWKHDVEFRFDKVISEGSSPSLGLGNGDLEKLVLLSPTNRIPVVHWKRDRITVRPREGWKPNRVYRVELLPGLTDLRRNRLDTTVVITFSTGGGLPSDTLRGIVIDWVAGRTAPAALVELVLLPDSLVYRSLTDSSGRFNVGPLPHGNYLVYAAIDQNHNLRRELRESYDSAVVMAGGRVPPLWLIPRDTLGPRITQITPGDSVSATVAFSQPLDPTQRFDSAGFTLRKLPDSVPVPIRSILPKALDDSLRRLAQIRADSIKAAADTTKRDTTRVKPVPVTPPKLPPRAGQKQPRVDLEADSLLKTRPALFQSLVLRVDSAFVPETKYVLDVARIRSAAGVTASARGVLAIPKPRPVPPPAAADSTQKPGDTTGVKPPPVLKRDSTGRIRKPVKPVPTDTTTKPRP
jgi:hypothetical protein